MPFVPMKCPPVHVKSPSGSTSGTEDSDSDSDSGGSDNDDIPNILGGVGITAPGNKPSEDNSDPDIVAQFQDDDGDSQDPENDSVDEPDYLIKSDIADPNEISIDVVRDMLSQMPGKYGKNGATAAMLEMQPQRPCIIHTVWKSRKIIWERLDNVEAIIMQIVGSRNPIACRRCVANKGPFVGCYSVPGIHSGGCGCCKYNAQSAKCSLYNGSKRQRRRKSQRPSKKRKHDNEAAKTKDAGPSHAPATQPLAIQNSNRASLSSPAYLVQPQPQQRILQVPIPAELGWEDAMTLRRALQEMGEQLVFSSHGSKVVRKVLREFSGALEDFASEEQE
ncbi:hypothetical protein PpBr36_05496 [Pyricularia pennisetigena]|uniref:hypothetical protein n=1 Tax=Pyricularia pennisetigena TaxID=1578925 RepID=UPI0011515004|nr:hypothetical protein PpBr36_05496 [Pyricularia pennisetigena]TLS26544.1 hypothetical protein PpBr36_05496 [Pyricularia pennisetigena]